MLKMVATAFDWSDAQKDESNMSAHHKKAAISHPPSLLEMLGYSFYFGGLQGGPFFQFRRYKEFTEGRLFPHPIPPAFQPAFVQFLKGIIYLVQHLVMDHFFLDKYTYSNDFDGYPLIVQLIYNSLWLRKVYIKYFAVWIIADVSCILSGMGYNGKDDTSGEHKWDGMCTLKPLEVETGCTCQSLVGSFNIRTNNWVSNYVFKRLRFLQSKLASGIISMIFLSIWHGFHVGYFLCFLGCEIVVFTAESQVIEMFKPYLPPWYLMGWTTKAILYTTGLFYKFTFTSYAIIAFVVLDTQLSLKAWERVYFLPHVACLVWFATKPLWKQILEKKFLIYEERKKSL
jgi:lysophospholipid acyltransferase 5